MNIWATVDFGNVKVTQAWKFLADEIGEDSKPHDFIQILVIGERKQLVIQLEKESVFSNGSERCYLGTLKAADALILS
jgi:hypothetical protein